MLRYALAFILLAALFAPLCGCATRAPGNTRRIERTMIVTGYCSCKKCANWTRNWRGKAVVASGPKQGAPKKVGITASGTKAKRGVIAADTTRYPFGTVMQVPGYGKGRVEDRGSAIKGDKIDLYFKSHRKALQWGRRTMKVTIWLPR